jgi:large subunit ribosomal protein L30
MASLKITLVKSPIGFNAKQRKTADALGLGKLNKTVIRPDNDQVRGMCRAIEHLLEVEVVESADA